jgi:IPT/TIG domain-containing protein
MRRLFTICLLALSATALLVSAPAGSAAKRKKASKPSITRVTPMRISVGNLLTIRGRNFKPKRTGNTIIFRAPNGRTAFAKPRRASRTKLVVVVPEAVARLLNVAGSRQRPTRLKLRVLAGRFSAYTPRRLSPVVTGVGEGDGGPGGGAGGAGGGAVKVCADDGDHDNDLLENGLEGLIGTDACLADTDGDQMTDGWEFYAARDLNVKAVPYPGKRPFPNALDPSDGGAGARFSAIDFDGDGLTTLEEYRAWRSTGSSFNGAAAGGLDLNSPLGYSDGTKFSRSGEAPAVPAWRSASYGLPNPAQPFPATYNLFGDGAWRDSERDADGDGLANWLESARGPSTNDWWQGWFASTHFAPAVEPWKLKSYCGYRPGFFDERPFTDLDLADGDVDGDSLLDGEDDQDNDDVTNIVEIYETQYDLDGNGQSAFCGWPAGVMPTIDFGGVDAPVNAMNPCVPNPASRTCQDFVPFG